MSGVPLPRIINAAGHLSALGGAVSPAPVAEAVSSAIRDAMTRPVDMQWLKDVASERIALSTGAEAGCVTTGAAAGIALSVAACVTRGEPDAVRRLPDAGEPRSVVLQAGHDIDFGAPVVQMVRAGGGRPVLAGTRAHVSAADLGAALPGAAAFLFVRSHHVTTPGRLSLETCVASARAAGVPVIVDAAAEEDLSAAIATGADLAIYSGGKALGGLSSSGLVAGRAALIRAVRAQERGIGRAMKVGPEQVLSVVLTLEMYRPGGEADPGVLRRIAAAIGPLAPVAVVPDEAGRAIDRLEVRAADAEAVVRALRANDPPVVVRAHHAADGRFAIDPRNLREDDLPVLIRALQRALGRAADTP